MVSAFGLVAGFVSAAVDVHRTADSSTPAKVANKRIGGFISAGSKPALMVC
jgi:hypothetical protein